jgi:hypothetical protein
VRVVRKRVKARVRWGRENESAISMKEMEKNMEEEAEKPEEGEN